MLNVTGNSVSSMMIARLVEGKNGVKMYQAVNIDSHLFVAYKLLPIRAKGPKFQQVICHERINFSNE